MQVLRLHPSIKNNQPKNRAVDLVSRLIYLLLIQNCTYSTYHRTSHFLLWKKCENRQISKSRLFHIFTSCTMFIHLTLLEITPFLKSTSVSLHWDAEIFINRIKPKTSLMLCNFFFLEFWQSEDSGIIEIYSFTLSFHVTHSFETNNRYKGSRLRHDF